MRIRRGRWPSVFLIVICSIAPLGLVPPSCAQTPLSLQEAVARALESRASLRAESQRVAVARGLEQQSSAIQNPTFQFENQNLRPGQTYSKDVDTYAFLTQPLDILGKRGGRIAVARTGVASSKAEYELRRLQVAENVKRSYWRARGAQEIRDLLKAEVTNFQGVIEYHSAQLSVGAISEQDFLRVRLEGERLKISENLASIEASHKRMELQAEMGQTEFPEILLDEPLDVAKEVAMVTEPSEVLRQRLELKLADAQLREAVAKAKQEDLAARPDLNILYGYKRTELADSTVGTNSALAGMQVTLPITDRNQGNRAAANAEVERQRQLLAAAQANVLADFHSALQEYQMRRAEVTESLRPLREHAAEISRIAKAAYAQGAMDVLRLLDAERAQLEAEVGYVQGMVDYQESVVNLEAAEGVSQ